MIRTPIAACAAAVLLALSGSAWARDGHTILIPARSPLSPVQKLNREGVEAVRHLDYQKAEALFLKAYLYDPADPFTLNNLGYISEIQGQLDRARRFYDLADEQGSNANIDLSSQKHLQGQPMKAALIDLQDRTMRVNRMNIDAMRLLQQDRNFEAIALLQQALAFDRNNPFTLNNLGVASETVCDLDSALAYYQAAAATGSSEPAEVTLDRSWRGKPVSRMAAESARRLRSRMDQGGISAVRAEMYTLRGVYAENQNRWDIAREDFLEAWRLDPASAFTLNNRGYVAEREGDLETAQFYNEKARRAEDSPTTVGLATRLYAEGKPLGAVAGDCNRKVDAALDIYSRRRRQPAAQVELTPRDNTQPISPATPRNQQPE